MYGHQPQEPPARGRGRGRGREGTWSPPLPPGTMMDDAKEPRQKHQRPAMDNLKEREEKPRSPRLAGRGRARPRRPEQQLYVPKALRSKENQDQSSVSNTKGSEQGSREAVHSENTLQRKGGRVVAETDSCAVPRIIEAETKATQRECSEVTQQSRKVEDRTESVCSKVTHHLNKNTNVTESVCSEVTHLKEDSGVTESVCSEVTRLKEDSGMTESVYSEVTHLQEDSGVTVSVCSEITKQPKEEWGVMESVETEQSEQDKEDSLADITSAKVGEHSEENVRATETVDTDVTRHQSVDTNAAQTNFVEALMASEENISEATPLCKGATETVCTELTDKEKITAPEAMCTEEPKARIASEDNISGTMCSGLTSPKAADEKCLSSDEKGETNSDADDSGIRGSDSEMRTTSGDAGDASHMEASDSKHSSDSEGKGASQGSEEEDEEDSWDKLFDDNGDCLNPSMMEELTSHVGKVEITKPQKTINYLDYTPRETDLDMTAYSHVLEISDFPATFQTTDLLMAFKEYMNRGFDIKWVDDTHALGVFSSGIAAKDALNMIHPMLKLKPLSEASKQSQLKAKRCQEFLQPYKARPQTSAAAARRLVTGALGLAPRVPKEKREEERKVLKEAREKKRSDRKRKEDIWDGKFGNCAMDNC